MNKKLFFESAMLDDNFETEKIVSDADYFWDYVSYCAIELKEIDEVTEINIFINPGTALSEKERHRRHRKSLRKEKAKRKMEKNSHWAMYMPGTATQCKRKNHKATRREYDIPMGKGNFTHKLASFEYFY